MQRIMVNNFIIMQIAVTFLTYSFENLLCVIIVLQNPCSVSVMCAY